MSAGRIGPAIIANVARRIAEAADFGHCLECGAPIPFELALGGRVLCDVHDAEAEAWELDHAERRDELAHRINAEAASYGAHWSPRWTPAPQGELAL